MNSCFLPSIAKQNQKYALDIGEQQAEKAGIAGAAQAGRIKAAQGASGVDVNSGSAKEVQTSQHLVSQSRYVTLFARRPRRLHTISQYRRRTTRTRPRAIPKLPAMPEPKAFLARCLHSLARLGRFLANGFKATSLVCGARVVAICPIPAPIH